LGEDDGTVAESLTFETFLFVHQTCWQKEMLLKYGQEIVLLDATYKTCRSDLPVFFLSVLTNSGYTVVGTFIIQRESRELIKEALQVRIHALKIIYKNHIIILSNKTLYM